MAFHLLHMCADVVKISYLLRFIPPRLTSDFAKRFDALTGRTLRNVASGVLPDTCIEGLRLSLAFPKPSFGVGLTSATDVAASSFLGSINLVQPILTHMLPSSPSTNAEDPEAIAAHASWKNLIAPADHKLLEDFIPDSLHSGRSCRRYTARGLRASTQGTNARRPSEPLWASKAPKTGFSACLARPYIPISETCISGFGSDSIAASQ